MVLVTSVFLVQLLCVIVPCDPVYPYPDLSLDPNKINPNYNHLNPEDYNRVKKEKHLHLQRNIDNRNGLIEDVSEEIFSEEDKDSQLLVSTRVGKIKGYFMKVVGGREISAFEGIPYAEPPVDQLRFRSPVPKKPWKGILKAQGQPQPCLQYNVPKGFRIFGQEDCLYLNVYTPISTNVDFHSKPKLPVIVFLHGGGFFLGSVRVYGPSYILQKDVVLCMMQYRLGVLGFMSSGDAASSGNWGLKDQVLALKWIHENIEFFGGDPNKITIMGQSAGSALVHFHMLSRQSRPYFHRAISMSGVAFNYWALHTPQEARNYTMTLAGLVGCPTYDSWKMVDCIRNKNPVQLVAQTQFFLDNWPYPSNAWRPCIEALDGGNSAGDLFLTESPLQLYAKGDVAPVPWIVTLVSGEGYEFLLFPFISFQLPQLRSNWHQLAPDLADLESIQGLDLDKIVKKLTRFYFRKIPPDKAPVHNFANIVTDRMFLMGIYKAAQAHVNIAPTYSYIFDVNGQYNIVERFGYSHYEWGVGHAEDIFYLYNSSSVYHGFGRKDPEFEISQLLVNLITNFADKGEPLYTQNNGQDVSIWSPHESPVDLQFLKITFDGPIMIRDPFKQRIRFWDRLRLPDTPSETEIINLGNYGGSNAINQRYYYEDFNSLVGESRPNFNTILHTNNSNSKLQKKRRRRKPSQGC